MENVGLKGVFTLKNKAGDVLFSEHNLVVYGGYDTIAAIVGAQVGSESISDNFQVRLYSGGSNSFSRSDTSIDATLQAATGVSNYDLDTEKHSVILNYTVSATSFNGTTTLTTAGLWFGDTLFSEVDLGDLSHEANTEYVGTWEIIFGDDTIPVGDGTEDSPYLIANATQLDWFRAQVNSGSTGLHAALISGITYNAGKDVSGYDGKSGNSFTSLIPICTASGGFTGTFDGRGNTISGLYINTAEYTRAGLFGYLGSGGVIKDVIVTNSYIASSYTDASYVSVGGIAGSNYGTVSGCTYDGKVDITADNSESEVSANFICGGIAGINYGTVSDCTMSGSVDVSGTVFYIHCGGIVGSYGTVSDCTMSGSVDVTGTASYIWCGGITGGSTVSGCTTSGSVDVTGTASFICCGGITGGWTNVGGDITASVFTGSVDVSGTASTIQCGGIVGYMITGYTNSENTMSGSVDVSGTASIIQCGGIVGFNGVSYVYENSLYGTYTVTGSGSSVYTGAIVAYGTTSSTYVYDNYDYTSDTASAAALESASVSVASVSSTTTVSESEVSE